MIRRTLRAATIGLLLMPAIANAEDYSISKDYSGNYLCKMTASVGIRFDQDSDQWVPTGIHVDDQSYIVNVIDTGQTTFLDETDSEVRQRIYNIMMKLFVEKAQASPCINMFASGKADREKIELDDGFTTCKFLSQAYSIDFETLKIQLMYAGGYMDSELNPDPPFVSVGKCQRID